MSHYGNESLFDIPRGWSWCKLYDVCIFESGFAFKSASYRKSGVALVRISNIQDNAIALDECVYIQESVDSRYHIQKGDLLIALSGATTGKMGVYQYSDDALLNQRVGNLRVISPNCFIPEYRNLFLSSKEDEILKKAWGGAQPNISPSTICDFDIPLPPVNEQSRIVLAVSKCMSIVDFISREGEEIKASIDKAKVKILELAIHGKLVPQNPADEPALGLLKRINPTFKPSDNLHDIDSLPKGWCFSTIGDIFQHNTGKALNGIDHEGVMLRYITTSNLYWDRFDLSEERTMPFTEKEQEKCRAQKGDLLVCEGGDIGRAAIWPYEENIMIQNHIHRLRPKALFSVRFFYYIFYLYKQKGLIGGKGIGIQGLSSRELDKMVIPVPPVNEQHRIVTAIEEKFAVLDTIADCC